MDRSTEKKTRILRAAAELFSHNGYSGTGIAEIVAACSIPKGSFYYYFPGGKEQLAAQVIRFAYDQMAEGIRAHIFSVSDDALTVFRAMLERLASLFSREHRFESLVITFMGLESVYISEEVARQARQVYEEWQQLYRDKLMACGYSPALAERCSLVLFTLVHGALISCWIKQDAGDLLRMRDQLSDLLPPPDCRAEQQQEA